MRFLLFAVNFSCRTLESNADQPKMLRFVDPPNKIKFASEALQTLQQKTMKIGDDIY